MNSIRFSNGLEITGDGKLISKAFNLKKNSCLSITYKSLGTNQKLIVGATADTGKSFEIWSSSVENFEYWNQDSIALPKGRYKNLEFFLRQGDEESPKGFLIKDVLFTAKSCFSGLNCDFLDKSLCGYELSGKISKDENLFPAVDFQVWV